MSGWNMRHDRALRISGKHAQLLWKNAQMSEVLEGRSAWIGTT
jgi:hypothetical protein